MSLDSLRNIGIIAHIDAGKTTFSERILFYTGEIHRMGEVHEGAATMDFMPEEQERGITIASACTTCVWQGHTINLLDTPGHVDFTVEVERSLRVLDAAIGIFCAVGGVEPQSETVWRQADNFDVPRLAVVNKMDRAGADFQAVLKSMSDRLKVLPVPLVIPLGEGEDFEGVLDLVSRERVYFDEDTKGLEITRLPFTAEDLALAEPWLEKLFDAITGDDDVLLELYLTGEPIPLELVRAAIRRGVLAHSFVPVFAASALKNIGVQPVLDAVCYYLPSPLDVPALIGHDPETKVEIQIAPKADDELCALVFKVVVESKRTVAFVRIYAGTLKQGGSIQNVGRKQQEKVHHLYRIHADSREPLEQAVAGDIVAVIGLKSAQTGDTLTSFARQVLLEPLRTWQPVISLVFEPQNQEQGVLLDEALGILCVEDPTLKLALDEVGGQRIVSGMGELHLEIVQERLKREFKLAPRVGNPQVVCRETVAKTAQGVGLVDSVIFGATQYGYVELEASPAPRGSGTAINFAPKLATIPENLRLNVLAGVENGLNCGFNGYALDDLVINILALENPLDTGKQGKATERGLYMAAMLALRQAVAETVVLEPFMQINIVVPDDFLGAVMSLLGTRGAKIEDVLDLGGSFGHKEILAFAPMRELFGFSTYLRSATQGRAGAVMKFARFDKR